MPAVLLAAALDLAQLVRRVPGRYHSEALLRLQAGSERDVLATDAF